MLALLALAVVSAGVQAPPFVEPAIRRTLPTPEATIAVISYSETRAAGCVVDSATALAPPNLSGQLVLKLAGRNGPSPCEGWARVRASITIPVLVTTRAVQAGAPLADSVEVVTKPWGVVPRPVTQLIPGALATEALETGTVLDARHEREPGPAMGDPVNIVLQSGSIRVTEVGRRAPCDKGYDCAILPSGTRVEGHLSGDQLLVEVQ